MGLKKMFNAFSLDIGIDLGTCNTLIYIRGKGIVICEPSVVAVERGTKKLWLWEQRQKRCYGKPPEI